jgi:hypothetical protein
MQHLHGYKKHQQYQNTDAIHIIAWVAHADESDAIQLDAIMKSLHGADAICVLHRCAKQTAWTRF